MITKELFNKIFPIARWHERKKYNLVIQRDELIAALNKYLPKYGIDNYFEICAFLGCNGVESDYFKTTTEYASGAAYEGRSSLGNYFRGDGRKYKGRGVGQNTGRYNYWRVVCAFVKKHTGIDYSKDEHKYKNFRAYLASPDYSKLLKEADKYNCNFLEHPERLAEIEIATEAACIFWNDNNLNYWANKKAYQQLNGIVNRGSAKKLPLHWDKRKALTEKCLRLIPTNILLKAEEVAEKPVKSAKEEALTFINQSQEKAEAAQAEINWDNLGQQYQGLQGTLTKPSTKQVLKKFCLKIFGGFLTVWGTTEGKIMIILTFGVILFALAGLLYSYRNQIRLGYQNLKLQIKTALETVVYKPHSQ